MTPPLPDDARFSTDRGNHLPSVFDFEFGSPRGVLLLELLRRETLPTDL